MCLLTQFFIEIFFVHLRTKQLEGIILAQVEHRCFPLLSQTLSVVTVVLIAIDEPGTALFSTSLQLRSVRVLN